MRISAALAAEEAHSIADNAQQAMTSEPGDSENLIPVLKRMTTPPNRPGDLEQHAEQQRGNLRRAGGACASVVCAENRGNYGGKVLQVGKEVLKFVRPLWIFRFIQSTTRKRRGVVVHVVLRSATVLRPWLKP